MASTSASQGFCTCYYSPSVFPRSLLLLTLAWICCCCCSSEINAHISVLFQTDTIRNPAIFHSSHAIFYPQARAEQQSKYDQEPFLSLDTRLIGSYLKQKRHKDPRLLSPMYQHYTPAHTGHLYQKWPLCSWFNFSIPLLLEIAL